MSSKYSFCLLRLLLLYERGCRWAAQIYDPLWTETAIIRGLTRLPQLQDLQLIINRDALSEISVGHIHLDRLSELKKISLSGNHVDRPCDITSGLAGLIAKSPQLVHLEVHLGYHGISPETPPTLHDVLSKVPEDHPLRLTHLALNRTSICVDSFTLPHLRSLISLDLRNLPAPPNFIDDADPTSERLGRACSTSDICAVLKQEGIYLKHLFVSDVGVFDYLCSYSGLETLDLCSMSFNTVEESNASARTFYRSVLPQLVHSLQVLKIQPKQEGQWCFNPEDGFQSVVFSQCNKLRSLCVALNSISSNPSTTISISTKTILMLRYVLVISLFSRPCHKYFCRSHHSSAYRSAYPPLVKFVLLYQNWDSRVMSLS